MLSKYLRPNVEPLRNLVFIGRTGSGKSSICNKLFSPQGGPFIEGHGMASKSQNIVSHISQSHDNIKLIDTPGLGDNKYGEEAILQILRQLSFILTDPRPDSTGQIDAFVLVERLNPRASSLKFDIEMIRNLFGTVALKSVIIVFISDEIDESFDADFRTMKEVVKMLSEGKEEELNKNWYCMWSNKNPRPGQEEELLNKIKKLEPYTNKKYLEAAPEIKKRCNASIQEEIDREVMRVKRDYENDLLNREKQLQELNKKFEKEKSIIRSSQEQAFKSVVEIKKMQQMIQEKDKPKIENLYTGIEMLQRDRPTLERLLDDQSNDRSSFYENQQEELSVWQPIFQIGVNILQHILGNQNIAKITRVLKFIVMNLEAGMGKINFLTTFLLRMDRHGEIRIAKGNKINFIFIKLNRNIKSNIYRLKSLIIVKLKSDNLNAL